MARRVQNEAIEAADSGEMEVRGASDRPDRSLPMTRRTLLAGAAVAGAGGLLGPSAEADGKKGMPTAILGRTGMRVSRLAMGGAWDVDPDVVGVGLQHGINYIDTAQIYNNGQSEVKFGAFLQQVGATGHSAKRKKLWVVSKTPRYDNLASHLDYSLGKMQQDYLDCFYLHGIDNPKLPADPEIKAAAEKMKKSGKLRFFGFSCHDAPLVACLEAAAKSGFIDVIMFKYDMHFYPSADLNRAIDQCHKAGIGLVAMKTQAGGMTLPDKVNPFLKRGLNQHQAAVKAVATDERITSICSHMTSIEQIQQNSDAIAKKLTTAEADAIKEHAALAGHLWCRACDHICRPHSGAGVRIAVADTLRFLMYHDHYRTPEHARELFAGLPSEQRDLAAIEAGDWQSAEAACPFHVPIAKLMARAKERLG